MKYTDSSCNVIGELSYLIDLGLMLFFTFIGACSVTMMFSDDVSSDILFYGIGLSISIFAVKLLLSQLISKHKTIKEIELNDERVFVLTHANSKFIRSVCEISMIERKPFWHFYKIFSVGSLSGRLCYLHFIDGKSFIFFNGAKTDKLNQIIKLLGEKSGNEIITGEPISNEDEVTFTNWIYSLCISSEIIFFGVLAFACSGALIQSAEEIDFPIESLWPLHLFIASVFILLEYRLFQSRRTMVERITLSRNSITITAYSDHQYTYARNELMARQFGPKQIFPVYQRLYLYNDRIKQAIKLTFNDGRVFYITDQTDRFDEIMSHLE